MQKQTVCIVGLGYIGLPSAAYLASCGHPVSGVDISENVVATINRGSIHIVEPDLEAYVKTAVQSGKLKAYTAPQPSDVFMICVPTPFHHDGDTPTPNVDYVFSAARSIAAVLRPGNIIILESTSPVGTTRAVAELLRAEGVDVDQLHIAYCPERVLPGRIMTELVENDRVIGGLTPTASEKVAAFYRSFVKGEVLVTNAETAEMCKLTENSFRDVNIAFANELSLLCAKSGIDVWELIGLANRHPRVKILQPGVGVGGHCIAVDPWFLVSGDPENSRLIRTAREVNDFKPHWVIAQIEAKLAQLTRPDGKQPHIVCFGLAFKPDIDDLREAPALQVVKALIDKGHRVSAVEPHIESHDEIDILDVDQALEQADLIVVLVRHRMFNEASIKTRLLDAGAMDFCGMFAT